MNIVLNESDRSEILRYLGYRGGEITETVEEKLKASVALCNKIIDVKSTWRLFNIEKTEEGLLMQGSGCTLTGKSIAKHLEGCDRLVLLCVTLGLNFDREVERVMVNDPTLAVCLNACGIQAIEKAADTLQLEINKELAEETGVRFSPGYGDLPLELQRDFIRILNTERMVGVRLNTSNLMIPCKSVTAVCGLKEIK